MPVGSKHFDISTEKLPVSADPLSARSLTRNVVWNLADAGIPLARALRAIPRLIDGLGTNRLGLLGVVWAGIGCFSLFDLGIGAAFASLVSGRVGRADTDEVPQLVHAGLELLLWSGLIAAEIVETLAQWLVSNVLIVGDEMVSEAIRSFWVLMLCWHLAICRDNG